MKRRLFLTGPMGCGKSTAIAAALGNRLHDCGGFLTRRYREPWLHFALETPDTHIGAIIRVDYFGGLAGIVTLSRNHLWQHCQYYQHNQCR